MNDLSPGFQAEGLLNAPLNPTMSLANADGGHVQHLDGMSIDEASLDGMPQAHLDGKVSSEENEVQPVRLCVTAYDFHCSDQSGIRNPILCALQRETGTLWRMYDDGFALEAMPPFRACQLPVATIAEWRRWLITGEMECAEWDVELIDTHEKDGYSLIQRRQTNLREKCSQPRM